MKKTNHQLLEKKLKNTFFAAKVSFKLFLCLCACPAVASAADAPGQLAAHYIDDGSKEDKSTLVNTGVQERRYELGVGDRLSLKVYQRDDLSGVLRVQDDGSISVPLLGKIRAVGRVPKQLEKEIASTLREMNGQWTSVAVEVLEWRPIYVVGGVNKPGVYSYSPGLTVLHAIALAGGFERFPATSSIELNASQNIITSRTAENRLMSLLIRRERLRSEISEKASIE